MQYIETALHSFSQVRELTLESKQTLCQHELGTTHLRNLKSLLCNPTSDHQNRPPDTPAAQTLKKTFRQKSTKDLHSSPCVFISRNGNRLSWIDPRARSLKFSQGRKDIARSLDSVRVCVDLRSFWQSCVFCLVIICQIQQEGDGSSSVIEDSTYPGNRFLRPWKRSQL